MKEAVAIARREFHLYHECREVREDISYDQEEMHIILNLALHGDGPQNIGKLNSGQMAVFDAIRQAIHGNGPKLILIDARGGTGKTFLLNIVLCLVRTMGEDSIALATAFTGIAAQLLQGGRTFNSRFKYPLKPSKGQLCSITKGSGIHKLIQKARLVLWDEAPMSNKEQVESLNKTFQDLMGNKDLFGGKVVVLAGDFRQLTTVIPKGNRSQIVDASLKRSHLWNNFKVMKLD